MPGQLARSVAVAEGGGGGKGDVHLGPQPQGRLAGGGAGVGRVSGSGAAADRGRRSGIHRPHEVRVVDAIPLAGVGETARKALRARLTPG